MNLLIIGATGGTGKHLLKQALDQGHKVTVLVRTPGKVKRVHPLLKVLKGDILKPESLIPAIQGQDAIISALGHKRFFIKTTILSRGTGNIVREMNVQGVNRFICITSLGINDSRFKLGLYYTLFVIPVILLFYFLDKEKQEKIVMKSHLNYTIVRPAALTNGKKNKKFKHGEDLGHYLLTKTISRANVARFILSELAINQYCRKAVALTN